MEGQLEQSEKMLLFSTVDNINSLIMVFCFQNCSGQLWDNWKNNWDSGIERKIRKHFYKYVLWNLGLQKVNYETSYV